MGPSWSGGGGRGQLLAMVCWVAPVMEISDLEAGYGLAAGKPMLVGYLARPAPDRESGLAAMIVSICADGVATYQCFAAPQELE
jgi:hypothetical protein